MAKRIPVVQEARFSHFKVQEREDGTIRIACDPDSNLRLVVTEVRYGNVWGQVYLRMEPLT